MKKILLVLVTALFLIACGNSEKSSKDSGKILKIAREKLGNDKVVKLPTLLQIIGRKIKNLFAKK